MRPRYFLNYYDDTLNGVYDHRASELVNRPPLTIRLTTKKRVQNGQAASATRLGKALVGKLAKLGIK